ncbi:MAG: ABC transporter ATP-binding protein [Candidatus Omnitrophota bacterium]|nr:ABC transporter ATP-binding protein [Candidatus Omnitrophota bacterium]
MLEAKNVSKSYGNRLSGLEVLKGIDLNIKEGEFLVIQGPSGAGKSTLLHILGALDNPTSGEVFFKGASLYSLSEGERASFRNKSIGFVFQFFHLLPELNALENVLLPCLLMSWRERKKASYCARALLERLGLSNRIRHLPSELSGGEQQRLALARALINKPLVLLCDEPTGNLDSENGRKILGLLRELNLSERVSMVLVTHDPDIAFGASRVVHLRDGMLASE